MKTAYCYHGRCDDTTHNVNKSRHEVTYQATELRKRTQCEDSTVLPGDSSVTPGSGIFPRSREHQSVFAAQHHMHSNPTVHLA